MLEIVPKLSCFWTEPDALKTVTQMYTGSDSNLTWQVLHAMMTIKKGYGNASDMMQLPTIRDAVKQFLATCIKDACNVPEGLMVKEMVRASAFNEV